MHSALYFTILHYIALYSARAITKCTLAITITHPITIESAIQIEMEGVAHAWGEWVKLQHIKAVLKTQTETNELSHKRKDFAAKFSKYKRS